MARQEHLRGSLYSATKRSYSHCEVVKRSDDQEGFELLPRRWVFSGTIYLFFRDVSFMCMVHHLVWLTEIILMVIALLYRYRSASSPLQRQQTK